MSKFGITREQLNDFMDCNRGSIDCQKGLAKLGGVNGICERLQVDPAVGLPGTKEDLERRKEAFGSGKKKAIVMSKVIRGGQEIVIPEKEVTYRDKVLYDIDTGEKRELPPVTVVRNGQEVEIPEEDVVVGDIVLLKAGMQLTACGILLQGESLIVDESNLTGEAGPISKAADTDAMLLEETSVVEGSGKMVVTRVEVPVISLSLGPAVKYEKKSEVKDKKCSLM